MRRLAGFSLVEVLVAFAVLTGVLVVIVPALSGPAGQGAVRVEAALAEDYAYSRLAAYGTSRSFAAGFQEGETDRWRWRDSVRALPAGPGFEIVIEVFDAAGRSRLAHVTGQR
ncbi:MAG: type II secretion system protein [Pseudomonadota bacterium]